MGEPGLTSAMAQRIQKGKLNPEISEICRQDFGMVGMSSKVPIRRETGPGTL
jgi:hypothetical protein